MQYKNSQRYVTLKPIGTVTKNSRETFEVNLIDWTGKEEKVDIRHWSVPSHDAHKGVTIAINDLPVLIELLQKVAAEKLG